MEVKLIGDPAAFAIDFSDITLLGEATYGRYALWLGGYPLRDADTPVCLDTVLACLQGVASAKASPALAMDALSSPMQMLRWMQEQEEIHKHFFLNIEGFDDFLKLFSKAQIQFKPPAPQDMREQVLHVQPCVLDPMLLEVAGSGLESFEQDFHERVRDGFKSARLPPAARGDRSQATCPRPRRSCRP